MKCKIPDRYQRFEGIKIPIIKKWFKSLKPKIKALEDPRGRQGRIYPLDYVFELYLTSCLAGYCDCLNCEEFLKSKLDIICQFIPRARTLGIPSHDCFCDCLSVVDQEQTRDLLKEFSRLCCKGSGELPVMVKTQGIEWEKQEESYHRNGRPYKYKAKKREVIIKKHLCFDGKASRGATDMKRDGKIPYTGGIFDATSDCFMDLKFIPNGKEEGEATILRQVLSLKNLSYTISTADALHTNIQTMATIRRQSGEFLLRLKSGSHPKLFKEIITELDASMEEAEVGRKRLASAKRQNKPILTPALERYQEKTFNEAGKARFSKTRIRCVVDDNNTCSGYSPHIAQIIHLKSTTTELDKDGRTSGKVSHYECCFVCSCILDIDDIYQFIREHWNIESAHWGLDNYFGEDRSTGRTGNQIYNRALFKRLAFNLLKLLEKCVGETVGLSTKNKFIFLSEHFGIALMLVNGLERDYCRKMAKVYGDRKKAYSKKQNEVDLSNVTYITM